MNHFLLVAGMLCALPALAAPLHTEQGAASTGLAGSATARVMGPGSIFHNPAAAADIAGVAVEIGGALVVPHHQVHTRQRGKPVLEMVTGRWRTSLQPQTPPAVFATGRIRDLALALAVFSPLVQSVHWPAQWPGRTQAITVNVKPLTINPVLAYRIHAIRVGMGVTLTGAWADESRVIQAGGVERTLRLQGPGAGLGFNAGLLFLPVEKVRVGVQYRSRTLMGFRQMATFQGGDALASCDSGSPCLKDQLSFADLTLPDVMNVGLAWRAFPATEVSVDGNLVIWSADSRRARKFEKPQTVVPVVPHTVRDTVGLRAAVEQGLIFVAPDLKLRAGVLVEGSPVSHVSATADAPWGDRVGASAGLGWRIFGVTLAAAYLGDVTLPRPGTLEGERVDYRSTTHTLSVSVGYQYLP